MIVDVICHLHGEKIYEYSFCIKKNQKLHLCFIIMAEENEGEGNLLKQDFATKRSFVDT